MSIASLHGRAAAIELRRATTITDPYMRADAIWEAALRVRAAADRLWGWRAEACAGIAWKLEESCEAGAVLPEARSLYECARRLDRLFGSESHKSLLDVPDVAPVSP